MTEVSTAAQNSWADILVREYKEGADDVEVMSALNLTRKEFDNNYEHNDVFKKLVDIGRVHSAAFWRRIARVNLRNKDFNSSVWSFNMKNRHGWAEKSESVNTEVPKEQRSTDELRQEILAKIPGVAKQLGAAKKDADILLIAEAENDRTE